MTDLDCEKYRHPDTARARRRDTYADHGVSEAERTDLADHLTRWLPYLHSVVEASRRLRGGEELVIGGDRWEVVHTPGHSLGHVCLWSPARRVLLSGDHLLPGHHPAGHASSAASTPTRCAATSTSLRPIADLRPAAGAARPRPPVRRRRRAGSRRSCATRCAGWRRSAGRSSERPSHRHRARRPARRQGDPRPPAPARDQRDARAHRLPALVGRRRAADPPGRRLRVVRHRRWRPRGARSGCPAVT